MGEVGWELVLRDAGSKVRRRRSPAEVPQPDFRRLISVRLVLGQPSR